MSNLSDAGELIIDSKLYSTNTTIIIFALGLLGNLLNILVLTNLKIFRRNRCAFYLIVESVVDIGQISHLFTNEILKSFTNGNDPESVFLVWCKLRTLFGQWFRLMLAFIVCFAAIDQFFSTNPIGYLHQWSSLKVARRQICVSGFLCLLHIAPFMVFLQIRSSSGCIITNTALSNYYSFFYYPVLNGLLPIFISLLFSLLAYRNVRRIVRRQIPIDRRRLDQQLTAMIFVRIISHTVLSLPYTLYRIFSLSVPINRADPYQYAVNQLVYIIVMSIVMINHAANFYIFLATSRRYRRQVKYFLTKKCWQLLKTGHGRPQNTVAPLNEALPSCDSTTD